MADKPDLLFFKTPAEMRAWLEKHHATAADLHIGFHKRHVVGEKVQSLTWQESVVEALCFGWIDGIRRSLGELQYSVRFTPRRKGSKWSAVNIRLMKELEASGKMRPEGRAVFENRKDKDTVGYTAQKKVAVLDAKRLGKFKKNKKAWSFFSSQPPGYQKMGAWWVMQAKQEVTRDKRLEKLIASSAAGKRFI